MAAPVTLTRRADFLAAAKARRQSMAALLLQARQRGADEDGAGIRVGYTCSKKVGNSVLRNRAKRRLRAAARQVLPDLGHPGWDYVLIGRAGATVGATFAALVDDLTSGLRAVHGTHRP